MTGKEIIAYIAMNGLYDKPVILNGRFLDFLTIEEAAAKFEVGIATVYVWYEFGLIDGVRIGDTIFISRTEEKPNWLGGEDLTQALTTLVENHSQNDG